MTSDNSGTKRNTFCAVASRIRCILNVATINDATVSAEQRRADVELGVRRVGPRLRGTSAIREHLLLRGAEAHPTN
jgi:hypothetical protein